jgi:hypothetical protein
MGHCRSLIHYSRIFFTAWSLFCMACRYRDLHGISLSLFAWHTTSACCVIKRTLRATSSFGRPNLYYDVRHKASSPVAASQALVEWVKASYPQGESGIAYCLSR